MIYYLLQYQTWGGSLGVIAIMKYLYRFIACACVLILLSGCVQVPKSMELTKVFKEYKKLNKQGRYDEAEPFAEKAVELSKFVHGPKHDMTGAYTNNLAGIYHSQGRYDEAETTYKRALAIEENANGPEHIKIAANLNNLAHLYEDQGRYNDAEALHKRALAIKEKNLGRQHRRVATSLNNLATVHLHQGRYDDAEPLLRRALAIREKALGANHRAVATSLSNLAAAVTLGQGDYADAEALLRRALAIREKALGPDHPDVATVMNNLAKLYDRQGRYTDGELLHKRGLEILEKALGPEHPRVATSLGSLAKVYFRQGRYADSERYEKQALTIREKALGQEHPRVASSLSRLADLYVKQKRYTDAEPLFRRALNIREKGLGAEHPDVASSFSGLANLYVKQDRYDDAEPLYLRVLAIREKAMGTDHPSVARTLNSMANLYQSIDRYEEALKYSQRASSIHRKRTMQSAGQRSSGGTSEQKLIRYVFVNHIESGYWVGEQQPMRQPGLTAETFEVGQLAKVTSTGAAIAGMSARFSTTNDALSQVVRERQDAADLWKMLDERLIKTISKPAGKRDEAAAQDIRDQLTRLDQTLKNLDSKLSSNFPEYAELTLSEPTSLSEIQQLLEPDEALLTYVVGQKSTFLWAVRRDQARVFKFEIGRVDLSKIIEALRGGLDPTGMRSLADIPPFDTVKALALYRQIFAAAEPVLAGAQHVIVVPDGPLQSLPLGVLVTRKTPDNIDNFSSYRTVPWLTQKYAMTTLPSVSSLRALRRFAKTTRAKKPFFGIGDPLLQGHPGESRGVQLSNLFTARGIADVDAIRTRLAPLPETADELEAMAKILGASKADLYLRENATETKVKSLDLDSYRVLAFATHGLISGDLKGVAEPSLVMTPPKVGTAQDDGLLTASEVAQLNLNADMVVLSACNTASADGSAEAEALSGLAKAFFYAGSRSLLVSHWPVGSNAAVKLTTVMLKEVANDNTIGRAEGLKRSMAALMADTKNPHYAHPMFWAPFVVVGEGGVGAP